MTDEQGAGQPAPEPGPWHIYQGGRKVGKVIATSAEDALSVYENRNELRAYRVRRILRGKRK